MSATNQFPPPHLISNDEDEKKVSPVEQSTHTRNTTSADGSSQQPRQQLALPSSEADSSTKQELNVSSTDEIKHTIKFNELGPLVINKDGTLSRIHNWTQMTEAERERTVRVLGKRNMLRKEAILSGQDEEK